MRSLPGKEREIESDINWVVDRIGNTKDQGESSIWYNDIPKWEARLLNNRQQIKEIDERIKTLKEQLRSEFRPKALELIDRWIAEHNN